MPIRKGASRKTFEHNLEKLKAEGKPIKQALAISYKVKREAQKKKYGVK